MDSMSAAILGFVQGITEFLPVSSSGHLVLGQNLFGLKEPQLLFDIIVHLGTLAAVLIFVRKEMANLIKSFFRAAPYSYSSIKDSFVNDPYFRLITIIAAGSVPTAIIGFTFKDIFTAMFASVTSVGVALTVTGLFLLLVKFVPEGQTELEGISFRKSIITGAVQGLAIIPGISRSGSTIVTALFLKIKKQDAAKFSFLLSLPAIIGALILEVGDTSVKNLEILPAVVGFLTAAISGYAALILLMKMLVKEKFHYFAFYCLTLGISVLLIFN